MEKISFVIPVYNEADNLLSLVDKIKAMAEEGSFGYEIFFVDDRSSDSTPALMERLAAQNPRVKGLRLARNSGSHVAIAAGMRFVTGHAAVIMAADHQDPPEVVREFVQAWHRGAEVVWGVRQSREDPWLTRKLAGLFYRVLRHIALPNYPQSGTGSFCLLDRKVIDAYNAYPEHNRITFGIICVSGFEQRQVPYHRAKRASGQSKWSFGRLLKTSLDAFTSYSSFPIRLISYFGLVVSLASFVAVLVLFLRYLFYQANVTGWPSLMVTLLFLGGIQLVMLGIIGEYIWRISEEVKGRPLYLIDRTFGEISNGGKNQVLQ